MIRTAPVTLLGLFQLLWTALAFQVFFHPLYKGRPLRTRLAAAAAIVLLHFLLPPRSSYLLVLAIHAVRTLAYAGLLRFQFRLQRAYALFLGILFLLCNGIWNKQLISALFSHPLPLQEPALSLIMDALSLILLYLMQRYVIHIDRRRTITALELFKSVFPPCATFIARIAIYHYCFYLRDALTEEGARVFLLIGAFLAFSTVISLAASELYFSYLHTRQELDRANQAMQLQYQRFHDQRQSDEQLKRLYHDMENHLDVLRGLSSVEGVQSYVDSLRREIGGALPQVDTGCSTLNLLLYQKGQECCQQGVTLEAAVYFPHGDRLPQMELCTLFANCIDNAREAVCRDDVPDKTIRVHGSERHGCLVVRFENAFAHPLHFRQGELVSSREGGLHGYGLKNVRAVLERHGGSLDIRPQGGRFVLTWMLPLDQLAA